MENLEQAAQAAALKTAQEARRVISAEKDVIEAELVKAKARIKDLESQLNPPPDKVLPKRELNAGHVRGDGQPQF